MAGYLGALEADLKKEGIAGPLLLMMSSGGITTVETARRYPVRLVESGPAGGAILALTVAAENALAKARAFAMGGTTAKRTPLHDPTLQRSRQFEGARGTGPTVTEADRMLGRLDPTRFAGGAIPLHRDKAAAALQPIADHLRTDAQGAAAGVAEIVDETMASAARVHAVENGKDTADRTLIAFGGAPPLLAPRLARHLGRKQGSAPVWAVAAASFGSRRASSARRS